MASPQSGSPSGSSYWSRGISHLTDAMKRRAGKYLINRYLGSFLEDRIILEQLSVDDAVSVKDVALNINHINELILNQAKEAEGEESAAPLFKFVDGYIRELSVNVPWRNLLGEDCFFSIDGLTITLQVRSRREMDLLKSTNSLSASFFQSMCESFSSRDMAEECIREEEQELKSKKSSIDELREDEAIIKGVDTLAQAIESIAMRVKLRLTNTTFRVEYVPTREPRGLAIELKAALIMYSGEFGQDKERSEREEVIRDKNVKKLFLEDVALYTDEFSFREAQDRCGESMLASMLRRESTGEAGDRHDSSSCSAAAAAADVQLPLQLASLAGKQEVVLIFTETNEFGLPRAVREVEMNLSGALVHAFPHQMHTMMEIINAVTVPTSAMTSEKRCDHDATATAAAACLEGRPRAPMEREVRFTTDLVEGMLRESMHEAALKQPGLGGRTGWTERQEMEDSAEFHSMVRAAENPCAGTKVQKQTPGDMPPVPKIKVRLFYAIVALLEKDEFITKLGGEASKAMALESMRSSAFNFFNGKFTFSTKDRYQIETFHRQMSQVCHTSHLALVGLPITIIYEEAAAFRQAQSRSAPSASSNYTMMTSVAVDRLSVREMMHNDPVTGDVTDSVQLVRFKRDLMGVTKTDFHFVYKDLLTEPDDGTLDKSSIEIRLNPCLIDFDPGFVDRTWILFNFFEFDPSCIITDIPRGSANQLELEISVATPRLELKFQVPKVDLRDPRDVPKFVTAFWSRKTHPEIFEIHLADADLKVVFQGPELVEPVRVRIKSSDVDVRFAENQNEAPVSLVQVKTKVEGGMAAYVCVSVCLDERKKLQGKYSSKASKLRRQLDDREAEDYESGSFFVPECGNVSSSSRSKTQSSSSNLFLQQLKYIHEALRNGRSHNNIHVDLRFDEIALYLPSKRIYEVIYNRLGNDMLLWLPEIYRVKEHLFDCPIPDPLRDPDTGFSDCFSGVRPSIEYDLGGEGRSEAEAFAMGQSSYVSFPRDKSSSLEIHVDTCVRLTLNRARVAVRGKAFVEGEGDCFLLGSVGKFKLTSVVGLERKPEIALFSLAIQTGEVRFGQLDCFDLALFDQHFQCLNEVVRPTGLGSRAWHESQLSEDPEHLLRLTAKILFDSESNLKTINLAFDFCQAAVVLQTLGVPDWVDWLGDFFTVVEYPVDGYVPPAILTEMQFDARHSSLEVIPNSHPARISLALGKAKVACNLLDTGKDVGISICLEDLGVFAARDSVDPVANSVCISDLDYLDLDIHLRETEGATPFLDVCAGCNLLRIRTCADTIQLITDIVKNSVIFPSTASSKSSRESSEDPEVPEAVMQKDGGNDDTCSVEESVVPEMADAMRELEREEEEEGKVAMERSHRGGGGSGAQVFFFPDEGTKLPTFAASTDQNAYSRPSVRKEESSGDDSLEEFCILDDEVGTGILSSTGEPVVKLLDDEGLFVRENFYAAPEKAINYLKPPKGFPNFQSRITLKRLSVLWQIFGGHDFSADRTLPVDTRRDVLGFSAAMDTKVKSATNKTRQIGQTIKTRGGPGRNEDLLLETYLEKVQFQHEAYPTACREASRQVLIVPKFEVRDRHFLSNINKLLHLYSNRTLPRQTNANMLSVRSVQVRPDLGQPAALETNISISAMPIRLNIDQDTLFFIIDFVSTLTSAQPSAQRSLIASAESNPGHRVRYNHGMAAIEVQEEMVADDVDDVEDLLDAEERPVEEAKEAIKAVCGVRKKRKAAEVFIRSFTFGPDVPIRIDYSAKYLDLTQGALTGLLAGFASLNGSEFTLKSVSYNSGILGFERLLTQLVTAWLTDIRQNQIPSLLGGVGPMFSVLQLFQGIKDLILMPLEQYQKDGRLIKGLQKGANSFTSSTAMSFLDFTNRLLGVIKFVAEMAFDVMSPEGIVVQGRLTHQSLPHSGRQIKMATAGPQAKPADLREGVINALAVVREGFDETARTLTEAATSDHARSGGLTGAVGGVLRQVPSTMMRPVIIGTAATVNVLEGVQSHVAPEIRREEMDKWRSSKRGPQMGRGQDDNDDEDPGTTAP